MSYGLTSDDTQCFRELVVKMNAYQLVAWRDYLDARIELRETAKRIQRLEQLDRRYDDSYGC